LTRAVADRLRVVVLRFRVVALRLAVVGPRPERLRVVAPVGRLVRFRVGLAVLVLSRPPGSSDRAPWEPSACRVALGLRSPLRRADSAPVRRGSTTVERGGASPTGSAPGMKFGARRPFAGARYVASDGTRGSPERTSFGRSRPATL
jgi:hypothetical protein